MPLHCAATRPKFLNVPSFSFSKPCDLLTLEILENQTWVTIFNDFLFSSVSSLALWRRLPLEGPGGKFLGTLERTQSSGTVTSEPGPPTTFWPRKRAHEALLNISVPLFFFFVFWDSFGSNVKTAKKNSLWATRIVDDVTFSTFLFRKVLHFMSSYPFLYPFLTKKVETSNMVHKLSMDRGNNRNTINNDINSDTAHR